MFALVALICFILALFHVQGDEDEAQHHEVDGAQPDLLTDWGIPWGRLRGNRA